MTFLKRAALGTSLSIALLSATSNASASDDVYHVTITNLTASINFTPFIAASHRNGVEIFNAGHAATAEMTAIAEGGNTAPLTATLGANNRVKDIQNTAGLLGPGQSVEITLSAKKGAKYISLASMMLPTNDGFVGLSNVRAPKEGTRTYYSPGYDAGTETNDELCVNIPGPTCGGTPASPEDHGEGFIHVNRGIHGVGDLNPHQYDWRNPVAKITITRD